MRHTYGLREKQFAVYVARSTASHETGEGAASPSLKLVRELESRLDNIVFRAGFANTRALARQVVSHGHIIVNGRRINIASHQVKIGDSIAIREGSKSTKLFADLGEKLALTAPSYVLTIDPKTLKAEVKAELREAEGMFDIQKVLEYYSR